MKKSLPPILTPDTAREILGGVERVSLDLGLTETRVSREPDGVILLDGERITLEDLKKVAKRENAAFFAENGQIYTIAVSNSHFYKLTPTEGAPTIEIDGIRMHRTKDTTPERDTRDKIRALGLRGGMVLDTCTGLGYTAIEALEKGASRVVTVEREPSVLRVALMNPWSRRLFTSEEINHLVGDSFMVVDFFSDGFFDWIIHDPPRLSRAGSLYGLDFYRKLYRVLTEGGGLYHYTGKPRSRYRGVDLRRGVSRRLREAGFRDIRYDERVRGLTCEKT